MSDRWYYAHEDVKIGPFSDRQLMDLAGAGQILRTDTVWKEGVEHGVLAQKVQHLFPPAPAEAPSVRNGAPTVAVLPSSQPAAPTSPAVGTSNVIRPEMSPPVDDAHPNSDELKNGDMPEQGEADEAAILEYLARAALPDNIHLRPEVEAPPAQKKPGSQQHPVRKLRAVVVKGATIVGQDGTSVKYRKKCMECGHEDTSYNTMRITNGPMKALLFCPKCRKKQEVKMQGLQG